MDITIIAETNDNGLHPVTSQMVAAATSLGSSPTILCPGGIATDSAASDITAKIKDVLFAKSANKIESQKSAVANAENNYQYDW